MLSLEGELNQVLPRILYSGTMQLRELTACDGMTHSARSQFCALPNHKTTAVCCTNSKSLLKFLFSPLTIMLSLSKYTTFPQQELNTHAFYLFPFSLPPFSRTKYRGTAPSSFPGDLLELSSRSTRCCGSHLRSIHVQNVYLDRSSTKCLVTHASLLKRKK